MNKIKALVMDVDGTLTDGMIYMGNNGEIMKAFNIKDGYGLKNICKENGIIPIIITGRASKIVENRCNELDISHVYQGISNKLDKLKMISKELGIPYDNFSYIGDDINDLECMDFLLKRNGLVGCPCDAIREIKDIATFVSSQKGGSGAVREFIDWIVGRENN